MNIQIKKNIFIALVFLTYHFGVAQNSFNQALVINTFNKVNQTEKKPNLYLQERIPREQLNIKNIIFLGSMGISAIGSTVFLISSKGNYKEYQNYRNDKIYTSNSFTTTDLQMYETERLNLLDNANKQRKIGNKLLGLGIVSFGVSFIVNDFSIRQVFSIRKLPQK
jgi:hypothetical protein